MVMVTVTVMKMKMLNGGDDNSGDDEDECAVCGNNGADNAVSYTHLRAHET